MIEYSDRTVKVPAGVFAFIEETREEDPLVMSSVDRMAKRARTKGNKDVAKWIKDNPIAYGYGFWNGFETEASPENDEPEVVRRKLPEKECE